MTIMLHQLTCARQKIHKPAESVSKTVQQSMSERMQRAKDGKTHVIHDATSKLAASTNMI